MQDVETMPDGKIKCEFKVVGNEKLDHLAFNYWIQNEAQDLIDNMIIKFDGKEELPDSEEPDDIKAIYTYYFEPEITEEPFEEEPEEMIGDEQPTEDEEGDFTELDLSESLKFEIAKEQIKRYNEGKMPKDWDPQKYLENLVNHEHISGEEKHLIEEAFLK